MLGHVLVIHGAPVHLSGLLYYPEALLGFLLRSIICHHDCAMVNREWELLLALPYLLLQVRVFRLFELDSKWERTVFDDLLDCMHHLIVLSEA